MPMPHRTFAQVAKRRLDRKRRPGADPRGQRAPRRAARLQERSVRGPPQVAASEIEDTRVRSSAVHRDSIAVRREGAAQIALVGPPNVGKSSLLQALSEIQIKTGDYPFTTLRPVPALTRIGGVLVQLVEIPGLIEGATEDRGGGRALLGVLRVRPTRSSTARRAGRRPEAAAAGRRARSRLAEIDKPAFLAATRADEAGPRRSTALRAAFPDLEVVPVSILDEASLDAFRDARLAADRADPRLPAHERRDGRRAARARGRARRSRTSPTGSTTTWRRRSAARGSGARRRGSTASASGEHMPSRTATSSRSSSDSGHADSRWDHAFRRYRSAVAQCRHELSALFERESAPVAQWIRAADFGLSRPMRCSPSVGGGA